MPRKRVLVSWSGGKDSAWALHLLQQQNDCEIAGLLTTVNSHFRRVAMHGFREQLLEQQAEAAGLPLWSVPLPWPCSNEVYEAAMAEACARAVAEGIDAIAFGDLFLEDIRAYREAKLAPTGLEPLFPCWDLPTAALAREMMAAGLRAHLVCVDPRQLDPSFAGRLFDAALLAELPAGVDPCGERGEFHTFVSGGPMFAQGVSSEFARSAGPVFAQGVGSRSIEVRRGEIVERDGFVYADLLPASGPSLS
jgi:uncharacterized protein (TIGR00290 family)